MRRRYSQVSTKDLEQLFVDKPEDQLLLRHLLEELDFRTSKRASTLRAEIVKHLEKVPTKTRHGTSANATRNEPFISVEASDKTQNQMVTNESTALELLRATFTAEGEILARWGMTGSMPAAMREAVFVSWHRTLFAVPDRLGRSLESLREDQTRLAEEAELRTAPKEVPPEAGASKQGCVRR